jgi:chemotaxis protein methyltransferase CheR
MERRLRAVLSSSGAPNLGELLHRVLIDHALFARVLDQLTVQVSEMFRDPAFYVAFREQVVPVLRTYPLIKIWHAGCAGGEEVYATAILLEEAGLSARSQIYATDLSASALARAKVGIYPARSAALFADNYHAAGGHGRLEDHCSSAYGNFAMKESLRRNVVFFQHDLVSDHTLGEMQVVFCRNVLLYFGPELRRRVLEKLASAVCRGGFLCLGATERLPENALASAFDGIDTRASIYRQRVGA